MATVAPANTIVGEGRGATSTLDPAKGERAEAALLPKIPAPSPLTAATAQGASGHKEQGAVLWAANPAIPTHHIPHHSGGAPIPRQPPTLVVLHAQVRENTACTTAPPAGEQKGVLSAPACSLFGSNLPEQEKNSDFNCTGQGTTHQAP